jgi:two-component system alkaline phosphatase synthesis response regulator PhoP
MNKKDKVVKSVLIVEDEIALRTVLKEKFSNEGFDVFEAENGEEGLNVATQKHPDMILLDIVMPKMDGNTMLKKLREDSWGNTASVMVLTNLDSLTNIAKTVENNAFEYFVKSDVKIEDLVSRVKEKLRI